MRNVTARASLNRTRLVKSRALGEIGVTLQALEAYGFGFNQMLGLGGMRIVTTQARALCVFERNMNELLLRHAIVAAIA